MRSDEKFIIEMENSTLTNIEGFLSDDPDLTMTVNRSDLETVMAGEKTLEEQIAAGKVILEGDATVLQQLASTMVEFDSRFEIMPGTHGQRVAGTHNPYEAVPGNPIAE